MVSACALRTRQKFDEPAPWITKKREIAAGTRQLWTPDSRFCGEAASQPISPRGPRKSDHAVLADRYRDRWHLCLPKTGTRRRPNFHDQGVYRCSGVARSDGTGDAGPRCRTAGEAHAEMRDYERGETLTRPAL